MTLICIKLFAVISHVIASSSAEDCEIKFTDSPNICKNERGHSVAIFDPLNGELKYNVFDTVFDEKVSYKLKH